MSTYSAAHSCPRSGVGRGHAGSLPGLPLAMHQPGYEASSTPQTIAGPLHTLWLGGSQCPAQESDLFTVTLMSDAHAGCALCRHQTLQTGGHTPFFNSFCPLHKIKISEREVVTPCHKPHDDQWGCHLVQHDPQGLMSPETGRSSA